MKLKRPKRRIPVAPPGAAHKSVKDYDRKESKRIELGAKQESLGIKVLLIDDMRDMQVVSAEYRTNSSESSVFRTCRTYDEGIAALQEDHWDILYLDHDLADYQTPERTGYTVCCWLERHPAKLPGQIKLVTSNPVGRQKMSIVIDQLYRKN